MLIGPARANNAATQITNTARRLQGRTWHRFGYESSQLAVPVHPLMWQMDGDSQEVGFSGGDRLVWQALSPLEGLWWPWHPAVCPPDRALMPSKSIVLTARPRVHNAELSQKQQTRPKEVRPVPLKCNPIMY